MTSLQLTDQTLDPGVLLRVVQLLIVVIGR
jgi:hypothetical protein